MFHLHICWKQMLFFFANNDASLTKHTMSIDKKLEPLFAYKT
jgi:hypothetical protein